MKSIFIKITPYVISFLIINFICFKTSNFFVQENQYSKKIDSVISSKNEIIFLGDSHVETIKLLDLSKNVGNLAFGGDGINEMYIKTLLMDRYNKNLKYVFISTEPQIFNNSLSSNSTFLNKYLLKLQDYKNVYSKSKLDLIIETVPLFNDSYIKYFLNKIYLYIKMGSDENMRSNAWSEIPSEVRFEIATSAGKIDHNSIMDNKKDLEIFKIIIDIYKSNDIKIIGIRFPVDKNYLSQCNQKDLVKVNNFINSLNLNYNIDYSQEIQNPIYFNDADHLNSNGIEKLSKLIFKDTGIRIAN
jgi:hypothetical protein